MKIWHYSVICVFFISICSCSQPYEWKEIKEKPNNSDYSFTLTTGIQSYKIKKNGKSLFLKAQTYYFQPSSDTSVATKERVDVSFDKPLPQGDKNLESLICRIVQQGEFVPYADDFSIMPEGVCKGMGIWFANKKSYQWNLSFPEADEHGHRQLYAELNEYLYTLFPQLKKYPTQFPFSNNPPAHREGEVWSWYGY